MVEAGGSRESAEGHGRSNFGSNNGAAATQIEKAGREQGWGWRGGAWTAKGRGEVGNIGMLVWIQLIPKWEDDPVQNMTDVGLGDVGK